MIKKYLIENKYPILAFSIPLVIGLILSFFRFPGYDEIIYLYDSTYIYESFKNGIWIGDSGVGAHGFIFKIPVALIYFVTGPNIFVATISNVFFGALASLLMYKIFNHFINDPKLSVYSIFVVVFSYQWLQSFPTYLRDLPSAFALLLFFWYFIKKRNFFVLGLLLLLVFDSKEYVGLFIMPPIFLWIFINEFILNKSSFLKKLYAYTYKNLLLFSPTVIFVYLMFWTNLVPINDVVGSILKFKLSKKEGTKVASVMLRNHLNENKEGAIFSSNINLEKTEINDIVEPSKKTLKNSTNNDINNNVNKKTTNNIQYVKKKIQPVKKVVDTRIIEQSNTNTSATFAKNEIVKKIPSKIELSKSQSKKNSDKVIVNERTSIKPINKKSSKELNNIISDIDTLNNIADKKIKEPEKKNTITSQESTTIVDIKKTKSDSVENNKVNTFDKFEKQEKTSSKDTTNKNQIIEDKINTLTRNDSTKNASNLLVSNDTITKKSANVIANNKSKEIIAEVDTLNKKQIVKENVKTLPKSDTVKNSNSKDVISDSLIINKSITSLPVDSLAKSPNIIAKVEQKKSNDIKTNTKPKTERDLNKVNKNQKKIESSNLKNTESPVNQISSNEKTPERIESINSDISVVNTEVEKINIRYEELEQIKQEKEIKTKAIRIVQPNLISDRFNFYNYVHFYSIASANFIIALFQKILHPRVFSYISIPIFLIIISLFTVFRDIRKNFYYNSEVLFLSMFYLSYIFIYLLQNGHARYLMHLSPVIILFLLLTFKSKLFNKKFYITSITLGFTLSVMAMLFEYRDIWIKLLANILFLVLLFSYVLKIPKFNEFIKPKMRIIIFLSSMTLFTFTTAIYASYTQGQIFFYSNFGYFGEYDKVSKYINKNENYWINLWLPIEKIFTKDLNSNVEPTKFHKMIYKDFIPKKHPDMGKANRYTYSTILDPKIAQATMISKLYLIESDNEQPHINDIAEKTRLKTMMSTDWIKLDTTINFEHKKLHIFSVNWE